MALPVETFVPAVGFVHEASARLTAAEMIAANQPAGLGHIIVPAQGPNTVLICVGFTACAVEIFGTAFNFSPAWTINWRSVGGFGAGLTAAALGAPVLTVINQRRYNTGAPATLNTNEATNPIANKALVLTGNIPGLLNGGGSIMHIRLAYVVVPIGV